MPGVRSYRELIAWQRAIALFKAVYGVARTFPEHERFALTGQLRRAVVSIAANIAEGQGRKLPKDFRRHLRIAYGSLLEVETLLIMAAEVAYIEATRLDSLLELCAEVGRLINGLSNSLGIAD